MKQKVVDKLNLIHKKTVLIQRSSLIHNYKILKKRAKNSHLMCVVKGDAYGHGMIECTNHLIKNGANKFYTARLEDALKLRKNSKKIQIYLLAGVISKLCCEEIYKNNIIPIINNFDQLNLIKVFKNKIKFALHFDTGMNRLGFQLNDIKKIHEIGLFNEILFIMSHLTSSDDKEIDESLTQYHKLKEFNQYFKKPLSLCNSSGIFLNKKLHMDYVRPGKSLYGINPFPGQSFGLQQIMNIHTPILQVMNIKKGETIGYSKTFKAKKNMKVATIDFGYSDGLHRSSSNKGKVYIDNEVCPILGRVSMDLITIDVSKIREEKLYLGKPVEILGKNQSYEDIAYENSTNEHEILISLGKNSDRKYID